MSGPTGSQENPLKLEQIYGMISRLPSTDRPRLISLLIESREEHSHNLLRVISAIFTIRGRDYNFTVKLLKQQYSLEISQLQYDQCIQEIMIQVIQYLLRIYKQAGIAYEIYSKDILTILLRFQQLEYEHQEIIIQSIKNIYNLDQNSNLDEFDIEPFINMVLELKDCKDQSKEIKVEESPTQFKAPKQQNHSHVLPFDDHLPEQLNAKIQSDILTFYLKSARISDVKSKLLTTYPQLQFTYEDTKIRFTNVLIKAFHNVMQQYQILTGERLIQFTQKEIKKIATSKAVSKQRLSILKLRQDSRKNGLNVEEIRMNFNAICAKLDLNKDRMGKNNTDDKTHQNGMVKNITSLIRGEMTSK